MKLLRVEYKGNIYYGKLDAEDFISLGEKYGEVSNSITFKVEEARIIAPVIPKKIIAVGLNYKDHIIEMGLDMPSSPVIFNKFPQCVIGPNEDILVPGGAEHVDYEAELVVVISKQGFKIPKSEARRYILGTTCLNDVTYRKLQKIDGQWTRAKNYPTFCPIGPVIDTEKDFNNAEIELRLNGKIKQKSNTFNFLWNVEELIEFISEFTLLYPGDVITTGTTSGVGPMYPGDKVEIIINDVGTLTNYVK